MVAAQRPPSSRAPNSASARSGARNMREDRGEYVNETEDGGGFRDRTSPEGRASAAHISNMGGDKDEDLKIRQQSKINAMRAELYGDDPTPIERLLADRAVYCWYKMYV